MFGVVVLWVVCNACGLGEKAGIVGKVECAGKEATLLEDVGDVAKRTSMACVDVDHLRCGGRGTGSGWRETACGLLDKAGDGDAVVLVNVMSVRGVIPFDVCELAGIGEIFVGEAAVE